MRHRTEEEIVARQAELKDIIAESQLVFPGTVNIWSPSRIKKYLRKYSLGPGETLYGRAKNRYRLSDVSKARQELVQNEPRNKDGTFKNLTLRFLQSENSI